MTLDELSVSMNASRDDVERVGERLKDSGYAIQRLDEMFLELSDAERALATRLIEEWVLSEDESRRYDGLHLVAKFNLQEALPALHRLAERCQRGTDPGAPFERAKAMRIIETLTMP